jgi:hypothetical protein
MYKKLEYPKYEIREFTTIEEAQKWLNTFKPHSEMRVISMVPRSTYSGFIITVAREARIGE